MKLNTTNKIKVYIVIWVMSDSDQINTQCEGIFTSSKDAIDKLDYIRKDILSDLKEGDYEEDNYRELDNTVHYIIDDFETPRWDEIIIYEKEIA